MLKEVAEDPAANIVEVKSIDGKYNVKFVPEHGIIMSIESETTIDKISKEDQDKVLKELKELYPKKNTYLIKKFPCHSLMIIKRKNLKMA